MESTPQKLTVILVDSNLLFRAGIAQLLESQPDIQVVAECDTCESALQAVVALSPDVMLMEIESTGCDAAPLIKLIKSRFPDMYLVVLTAEITSDGLLSATLAGASGYLQKTISPDELFARLRGLQYGEAAMAPTTVTLLIERLKDSNCSLCLRASRDPDLTPREGDVLQLVARGLTNKAIGAALQISEHTVRNHLCSIYDKLNLKNRLQVAVYSVTHGLVDLENVM